MQCATRFVFACAVFAVTSDARASDIEVRIRNDGAVLQREDAAHQWQDVCTAPCIVRVSRDARYRIGGPGVRASQPFDLPREGAKVTLVVNKATSTAYVTGWTLGILGGALVLAGAGTIIGSLVIYPAAPQACLPTCTRTSGANGQQAMIAGGIIGIVIGGLSLVAGTTLAARNTTSIVVQNPEIDLASQRALPWPPMLLSAPLLRITF